MATDIETPGLADRAEVYHHLPEPRLTGTVADLDRKHQLDRKEVGKAVAKMVGAGTAAAVGFGVGAFASPNFLPGLIGALSEAAGSVVGTTQRQRSPEGQVWALVRGALDLGWLAIVKASLPADRLDPAKLAQAVSTSLDAAIQHTAVTIDAGFADRPENLAIVSRARTALTGWLHE